jgi:nucleoid-associated protein YgaU
MEPAKAFLLAIDPPKTQVDFQYNPTKYTATKAVDWKFQGQKGGDVAPVEFVQGQGRTVTMELFLDGLEKKQDVSKEVEKLHTLTLVDEGNKKDAGKPRPPRVEFHWAEGPKPFPAVIKNLDVTYTMFLANGKPARATVNLTLQEIATIVPKTNPTSGGTAGLRSHRVVSGETLEGIAFIELGSPAHWRYIAELNKIDNPFDLRPGQELAIAPLP